ncbi:MAG: site-specific integrase [Sphingobacteriaceae bacterium]|nr:site-specific integrase [Sphingobacteriaceae bacterium]
MLTIYPFTHKSQARYFLKFDFNTDIQSCIKQIPGYAFSASKRCWHIPANEQCLNQLLELVKDLSEVEIIDNKSINPSPIEKTENKIETNSPQEINSKIITQEPISSPPDYLDKINQFKSWMRARRYSESTVNTYCEALGIFFRYFKNKTVEEITNQDLINFNNAYILANQLSASFQNQIINAIKLFYNIIENKKLDPSIIYRPKREKKLPNVLSKEEVKLILKAHANVKHRVMLSLIYSCGLRCGELLNLKPADIDSKRNLLIVRQGKGKKDRITPLSTKTIEMLRGYYETYRPKVFLFEGMKVGEPYDSRSLQAVLKQALEKVGINKPVTLHWLRHSYATHLLENGTDLRYIQEVLGHSSSRTTEIYTHVSTRSIQNIVSPFDYL